MTRSTLPRSTRRSSARLYSRFGCDERPARGSGSVRKPTTGATHAGERRRAARSRAGSRRPRAGRSPRAASSTGPCRRRRGSRRSTAARRRPARPSRTPRSTSAARRRRRAPVRPRAGGGYGRAAGARARTIGDCARRVRAPGPPALGRRRRRRRARRAAAPPPRLRRADRPDAARGAPALALPRSRRRARPELSTRAGRCAGTSPSPRGGRPTSVALPAAPATATPTSSSSSRTRSTRPARPSALAAALTTALPVRFVTEARWIADILEDLPAGHARPVRAQRHPQGRLPLARARRAGAARRAAADRARGRRAASSLKGVDDALAAVAAHAEPARRHAGLAAAGAARPRASTACVSALCARRDGRAVRRQPRAAQALARRGDVRAAAGGLPHGRDGRHHGGHRPRRVRRARRERPRRRLGRRARHGPRARPARARPAAAARAAHRRAAHRARVAGLAPVLAAHGPGAAPRRRRAAAARARRGPAPGLGVRHRDVRGPGLQRRIEDEHRERLAIYDQRAWKAVVAVRREVSRGRALKQRAAGRVEQMLRR